jgi:hypothetical protein
MPRRYVPLKERKPVVVAPDKLPQPQLLIQIRERLLAQGLSLPSSDNLALLAQQGIRRIKLDPRAYHRLLFIFNAALTNGNPGYGSDEGHALSGPHMPINELATRWLALSQRSR